MENTSTHFVFAKIKKEIMPLQNVPGRATKTGIPSRQNRVRAQIGKKPNKKPYYDCRWTPNTLNSQKTLKRLDSLICKTTL